MVTDISSLGLLVAVVELLVALSAAFSEVNFAQAARWIHVSFNVSTERALTESISLPCRCRMNLRVCWRSRPEVSTVGRRRNMNWDRST
jgi:hypothetical protein